MSLCLKFLNLFPTFNDPIIEFCFIIILLVFSLLKEYIYENLHEYFQKERTIIGHIYFFEGIIAFGAWSSIYSLIITYKKEITDYPIATIGYFLVLALLGWLIGVKNHKKLIGIKAREKFHQSK